MLKPGDKAPSISLVDQHGEKRSLKEFAKRKVLVYFYPKADTPGCTQQSCLLSEIKHDIGRTAIIGISPDAPAKQLKFDTKYKLGFPLLSDEDHAVAKAYKVWKKKSMYGREYMGIERSAFLIGGDGKIMHAWYKVSPKDTPAFLLEALDK
jgi:peroxiredoxin Q/BCP